MKIVVEDAPVHLRLALLKLLRVWFRRSGIIYRESDSSLTIVNTEHLARVK